MEPKRQIDGVYNRRPRPMSTGKVPQAVPKPASKKYTLNKRLVLIVILALVVAALAVGMYNVFDSSTSLVPQKIQRAVNFSIYYPNTKKMPVGYTLDIQSFRLAQSGVVLFAVTYGDGEDITFSEQQQPSNDDINKFVSSYMPLNIMLQLPLGQAKIGAYGTAPDIQTVASLPIHNGPWLIITAPPNVSHDDLAQVMRSLTK